MMFKINRRNLIQICTGTALSLVLSQYNRGEAQAGKQQKIISKNGKLDVKLQASYQEVYLGNKKAKLFAYNQQIPGPILEAQAGDLVQISFTNNLPQPTNIHFHGLHIPPTKGADNVFLKISPSETFTYEFTIPKNHPAGIFWYHPHLHGLVAEQLFAGLAGLFIVRGELDQIPEIKAAKEEFLVLKDFEIDLQGNQVTLPYMTKMWGREGSLVTVNGHINPTLTMPNNGLLRLRILNASIARFYRLSLEEHPFYLIATDGGSITYPRELKEILLSPGERVDVLIKGDRKSGSYKLLNLPYNRGGMGMGIMGGGMMGRGVMMRQGFNQTKVEILATVNYSDRLSPVSPLSLPKKLIPVESLPTTNQVRTFELNHGMIPREGMVFLINGKAYAHNRIDTEVKLNTVEEWELINTGVMDHPFHLHINDFQIVSRNGKKEAYTAWKDTVLVRVGENVRIRVAFRDFTGKTVYHCHILDHEDLGMMGTINII